MNEYVFDIVLGVIVLGLGAFMRYALPWIKAKAAGTKLGELITWIEKAVKAAEQTIEDNTEKKEWVVDFIAGIVTKLGITITDAQIDALIEAAVNELNETQETTIETTITDGIEEETTTEDTATESVTVTITAEEKAVLEKILAATAVTASK